MQEVDLAAGASTIADPARAAMLDALLDGAPRSAGALAREAGVAASTASHHLGRLLDAGLVVVEPDGRRRAFRLARPEVAHALEALALVAPPLAARTRYDHLAGVLGVAVSDALLAAGAIAPDGERAYALSPGAGDTFAAVG